MKNTTMPDSSSPRFGEMRVRILCDCINSNDLIPFTIDICTVLTLHRKNTRVFPSRSILSDNCLVHVEAVQNAISGQNRILPGLFFNLLRYHHFIDGKSSSSQPPQIKVYKPRHGIFLVITRHKIPVRTRHFFQTSPENGDPHAVEIL